MKIGWLASLIGAAVLFVVFQVRAGEAAPAMEVKVAPAEAAETTVMEMDAIKIPAKDVWTLEKRILESFKKRDASFNPTPQDRAQLRQQLAQARVLIALLQKLAQEHPAQVPDADVDQRLKQLQEMLASRKVPLEDFISGKGCLAIDEFRAFTVAGMTLERALSKDVSEEDVAKIFEQRSDSIPLRRCSHILYSYQGTPNGTATRSKEEAKKLAEDVLAKAKADEKFDFAQMARETSDCPSGKGSGGDLNFSPHKGEGQMVPAFADALYKLPAVGAYSDVVETQYGFHVIKLTELRDVKEFAPDIRRQMAGQNIGKLIQQAMGEKQEKLKPNAELLNMLPAGETPPAPAPAPAAEPKKPEAKEPATK